MSIFSTLRAAHYLASDILPALRRFAAPVPDDADPYAERLARVRAEALAEREAAEEVSEPAAHLSCYLSWPHFGFQCVSEPGADCGMGEADECLCDEDGAVCGKCWPGSEQTLLLDATLLTGGITSESPPSVADEPAFTAWLARIDTHLAAIQNHLTSAAPGLVTPDAAPESPAPPVPEAGAGRPGLPWCAAEMRQVADILATTDSPFALGYANDLRAAANEHDRRK